MATGDSILMSLPTVSPSSDRFKDETFQMTEPPFKCMVCNMTFSRRDYIIKHVRTHTKEQPYFCKFCGRMFSSCSNLTVHIRQHTGERPFKCLYCEKGFAQSGHLTAHLRTHTGEKPYMCRHCRKTFSNSSNLSVHERQHTGERPYKCDRCEKSFMQSGEINRHRCNDSAEVAYNCEYCNKIFVHYNKLTKHVRMHVSEKKYTCIECGKTFTNKLSLTVHKKRHAVKVAKYVDSQVMSGTVSAMSARSKKTYRCTECLKVFTGRWCYNQHLQMHTDNRIYNCDVCQKNYQNKWNYIGHTCHEIEKNMSFKCVMCCKTFSRSSDLSLHVGVHTGSESCVYRCHHCGQLFQQVSDIILHMKDHSMAAESTSNQDLVLNASDSAKAVQKAEESQENRCVLCEKVFSLQTEYTEHLKVHVKEEPDLLDDGAAVDVVPDENSIDTNKKKYEMLPFKCVHCEKVMWQFSLYKQHVKSHLNEKSIGSNKSEGGCLSKSNEQPKSFKEKMYQCGYCESMFLGHSQFIQHMKTHGEIVSVSDQHEEKKVMVVSKKLTYSRKTLLTCKHCNSRFFSKFYYFNHLKIHNKELKQIRKDAVLKDHVMECEETKTCPDPASGIYTKGYGETVKVTEVKDCGDEAKECEKDIAEPSTLDLVKKYSEHTHYVLDSKDSEVTPTPMSHVTELEETTMEMTSNKTPKVNERVKTKLQCSYCGKTFSQSFQYCEHLYEHTGEKPYKCFMCDAAFSQSRALAKHATTHGKKSFRTNFFVKKLKKSQKPINCARRCNLLKARETETPQNLLLLLDSKVHCDKIISEKLENNEEELSEIKHKKLEAVKGETIDEISQQVVSDDQTSVDDTASLLEASWKKLYACSQDLMKYSKEVDVSKINKKKLLLLFLKSQVLEKSLSIARNSSKAESTKDLTLSQPIAKSANDQKGVSLSQKKSNKHQLSESCMCGFEKERMGDAVVLQREIRTKPRVPILSEKEASSFHLTSENSVQQANEPDEPRLYSRYGRRIRTSKISDDYDFYGINFLRNGFKQRTVKFGNSKKSSSPSNACKECRAVPSEVQSPVQGKNATSSQNTYCWKDHAEENHFKFECCDQTFASSAELASHLKAHASEKSPTANF